MKIIIFLVTVVIGASAASLLGDINNYRASRGLSQVTWSPQLASISKAWAQKLSSEGSLYHGPINHLACSNGGGGEIIFGGGVNGAFQGWKNSPGHNAIMLDGRNKVVGCGWTANRAVCQFKSW